MLFNCDNSSKEHLRICPCLKDVSNKNLTNETPLKLTKEDINHYSYWETFSQILLYIEKCI